MKHVELIILTMIFNGINLVAVLVAALAAFGLGSLWYSPLLFGKQWMKLSGVKQGIFNKEKQKGMALRFAVGFISWIVMSFVLAYAVQHQAITGIKEAIILSLWIWVGFIATITLGTILWDNKPVKLYLLNNAYNCLAVALMAVILVSWK